MNYYLFEQPLFNETHWCNLYKRAIKSEANNAKIKICENPDYISDEKGIAIILGTDSNWLIKKINELENYNLKIITVGPTNNTIFSHNSIMGDFDLIVNNAINYCVSNNKKRILLFGPNRNSTGDNIIVKSFLNFYPQSNIIWEGKSIIQNIETLKNNISNYDAIICCNMLTATTIVTNYKDLIKDGNLWLISLIDSQLGKYTNPTITSFKQNEIEIGKKSVHLALFIKRNWNISKVKWNTKTNIIIRESTNNVKYDFIENFKSKLNIKSETNFYNDKIIEELLNLEKLLNQLEDCDKKILNKIINNYTYQQIAEEIFLSENSVKYRVKRMENIASVTNRKDLINLILKYVNYDKLNTTK